MVRVFIGQMSTRISVPKACYMALRPAVPAHRRNGLNIEHRRGAGLLVGPGGVMLRNLWNQHNTVLDYAYELHFNRPRGAAPTASTAGSGWCIGCWPASTIFMKRRSSSSGSWKRDVEPTKLIRALLSWFG
jgi:hypothetical protein